MSVEPIRAWEDRQVAALRRQYPEWDIWFVGQYMGPGAWCARPKGAPVATINTDSPEHLVEAIAGASRAG